MSVTESIEEVYNKIAKEFDVTRVSVWNNVKKFLDSLQDNSTVLDIGCGNGKNMLYRKSLKFKGIDISQEQVNICLKKGLEVEQSSMTILPFKDNTFNNIICIASYHHLDNDSDRKASLEEMYRCLKDGGRALITVWAIGAKKEFTEKEAQVPWKSKDGNVYYRYYHMYNKDDLEKEIGQLEPRFKQYEVGWEAGNWWIILEK